MTAKELIAQLEKALPTDQVLVGGKSEFTVEIIDSDSTVSLIPLS